MKKVNKTQTLTQGTTVYHVEYGSGMVMRITYRKENNLVMCYFPKAKVNVWIGETELRSNVGDVTLNKMSSESQRDSVDPKLEEILQGLFAPRKP